MKLHIHYFAMLREIRGCHDEWLEVQPGKTMKELFIDLFQAHTHLSVGYACNAHYVTAEFQPADNDEIVFIPPLGGG